MSREKSGVRCRSRLMTRSTLDIIVVSQLEGACRQEVVGVGRHWAGCRAHCACASSDLRPSTDDVDVLMSTTDACASKSYCETSETERVQDWREVKWPTDWHEFKQSWGTAPPLTDWSSYCTRLCRSSANILRGRPLDPCPSQSTFKTIFVFWLFFFEMRETDGQKPKA